MLALLFSKTGAAVVAIIAVLGLLTFSHRFAYQSGRQVEREALLARSVEILRERNRVDDEVSTFDDMALCRSLGGVWVLADGTCQ